MILSDQMLNNSNMVWNNSMYLYSYELILNFNTRIINGRISRSQASRQFIF